MPAKGSDVMADAIISGVKVCVFDAYGTLFDVHSPTAKAAEAMGGKAEAVSRLWRQKQLEYTWLRSLMQAHADFQQVTGQALEFALETYGFSEPALSDRLLQAYFTLDAYDDVQPALERLRAEGFRTGILSNGSPSMLAAAVGSAAMTHLLDAVISVEDAGIYKPDARVYRLATERLTLSAGEVCFVSSNGWDAAGAAHFGFRVVWLNRSQAVPERLPGDVTAVVAGLGELWDLLDEG